MEEELRPTDISIRRPSRLEALLALQPRNRRYMSLDHETRDTDSTILNLVEFNLRRRSSTHQGYEAMGDVNREPQQTASPPSSPPIPEIEQNRRRSSGKSVSFYIPESASSDNPLQMSAGPRRRSSSPRIPGLISRKQSILSLGRK